MPDVTIAAAQDAPPATATKVSATTKWVIALFFVVVVIPGSVEVGIRMTPYRAYLFLLAIPAALRFKNDPTNRITIVDVLFAGYFIWPLVSLLALHGKSQLVFGSSVVIDYSCAYLIGRAYIRTEADFKYIFKCFIVTIIVLIPFGLVELLTRQRFLEQVVGAVLTQPGEMGGQRERFGLLRVRLSFTHPTIWGAFCAVAFANVYYVYINKFPRNIIYTGLTAFAGALAISSGALLMMILQAALISYDRVLWGVRRKWVVLIGGSGILWYGFQFVFGMTIIDYILSEFIFLPGSGSARMLHYEYGIRSVMRHPFFGVGANEWGSPFWLSQALDSFWLATSIRSGIPALLLVALAFVGHFFSVARGRNLDADARRLRTGYLIAFGCSMIMLSSVNFFQASMVYFLMICGAGAWFYVGPQSRPLVAPRRREPGRRRPDRADLRAAGRPAGRTRRLGRT